MFPKFLKDAPVNNDSFGSHERIAKAILNTVKNQEGGQVIGLEGNWGSGKSSIVKMLESESEQDKNPDVFPFDAWLHQNDPTRLSFLRELTRFCFPETSDKEWKSVVGNLYGIGLSKQNFRLVLQIALMVFIFIPLSIEMIGSVDPTATLQIPTLNWSFNSFNWAASFGWLFLAGILIFFWLQYRKDNANPYNTANSLLASLIGGSLGATVDSTSLEPLQRNFVDQFNTLCKKQIFKDHQNKKLIIIIENFDRLPLETAKKTWDLLQTFRSNHTSANAKNIWYLVLYDPEKVNAIFLEDQTGNASLFFDKSIQIRFTIPNPTVASWRGFLLEKLQDAYGQGVSKDDFHRVYKLYSQQGSHSKNPRSTIKFVNDMVSVSLQWQNYKLFHIAYYLLSKDNLSEQLESGSLKPYCAYVFNDMPLARKELGSILHNVPVDKAQEIILRRSLENLRLRPRRLETLHEQHGEAFWVELEAKLGKHRDDLFFESDNPHVEYMRNLAKSKLLNLDIDYPSFHQVVRDLNKYAEDFLYEFGERGNEQLLTLTILNNFLVFLPLMPLLSNHVDLLEHIEDLVADANYGSAYDAAQCYLALRDEVEKYKPKDSLFPVWIRGEEKLQIEVAEELVRSHADLSKYRFNITEQSATELLSKEPWFPNKLDVAEELLSHFKLEGLIILIHDLMRRSGLSAATLDLYQKGIAFALKYAKVNSINPQLASFRGFVARNGKTALAVIKSDTNLLALILLLFSYENSKSTNAWFVEKLFPSVKNNPLYKHLFISPSETLVKALHTSVGKYQAYKVSFQMWNVLTGVTGFENSNELWASVINKYPLLTWNSVKNEVFDLSKTSFYTEIVSSSQDKDIAAKVISIALKKEPSTEEWKTELTDNSSALLNLCRVVQDVYKNIWFGENYLNAVKSLLSEDGLYLVESSNLVCLQGTDLADALRLVRHSDLAEIADILKDIYSKVDLSDTYWQTIVHYSAVFRTIPKHIDRIEVVALSRERQVDTIQSHYEKISQVLSESGVPLAKYFSENNQ